MSFTLGTDWQWQWSTRWILCAYEEFQWCRLPLKGWGWRLRKRHPGKCEFLICYCCLNWQCDLNHSTLDIQASSAAVSQNFFSSHICVCGVDAPVADHLRASKTCVERLRGEPALEMGGSDDHFIVKATLLLKGCPVPSCSGKHQLEDLPQHCITWWREEGWQMMGWKGSRQNADSTVIKSKINNFRKNFHRRKLTHQ